MDASGTHPLSKFANPFFGEADLMPDDRFPAFLDPSCGELHFRDGIVLLTPQLCRLLRMLAAADGEVVPADAVLPLMRGYAASPEAEARRRAMLRRLRQRLAPTGLTVELRNGSGFRLHGEVRIRTL
jgi:DNA-binding response OmpR family regulator